MCSLTLSQPSLIPRRFAASHLFSLTPRSTTLSASHSSLYPYTVTASDIASLSLTPSQPTTSRLHTSQLLTKDSESQLGSHRRSLTPSQPHCIAISQRCNLTQSQSNITLTGLPKRSFTDGAIGETPVARRERGSVCANFQLGRRAICCWSRPARTRWSPRSPTLKACPFAQDTNCLF